MDLETTNVLLSNTLGCIFVGLQLYHVKKNPKVLPSISFVMLAILTLANMASLALDSETLCSNKQDRNKASPQNGGLIQLNEVIVKVVMVVSFLLPLRLLQLTVSARSHDNNRKTLRFSEEMTLLVIVLLYADGSKFKMLISWEKPRPNAASLLPSSVEYRQHYICNDLKLYASSIMDSFLLPQILINMFSNSKQKSLGCSFYIGTTFVRLLPHAYDLYSTLSVIFNNILRSSENPNQRFVAVACDVSMFWGLLLFAAIIYFQQKFGGRCILPFRLGRLILDGFISLLLLFQGLFDHLFRV